MGWVGGRGGCGWLSWSHCLFVVVVVVVGVVGGGGGVGFRIDWKRLIRMGKKGGGEEFVRLCSRKNFVELFVSRMRRMNIEA